MWHDEQTFPKSDFNNNDKNNKDEKWENNLIGE